MTRQEKGSGLTLFFGVLLLSLVLATAAVLFLNQQNTARNNGASVILSYASQALNLANLSKTAITGDSDTFEDLTRKQRRLVDNSTVAAAADSIENVNGDEVRRTWGQLTQSLQALLEGRDVVMNSFNSVARAEQQAPQLLTEMGNLAALLTPRQLRDFAPVLERFESKTQNIIRDLASLTGGRSDPAKIVQDLGDASVYLRQVIGGLSGTSPMAGVPVISGDDAVARLAVIEQRVDDLSEVVRSAIDAKEATNEVARAVVQMDSASRMMFEQTAGVRSKLDSDGEIRQAWWVPLALLGAALLSAISYMISVGKPRESIVEQPVVAGIEQPDKHQDAILRLLDEMGNLADGDLTVEATVTEDITGAIADAINYAIEALRDLVSTIDGAAESVDSAARQTHAAANHLAKASENQSKQVASATESIANMATSIEKVSSNAERSADVARHSVDIAHKGGEAVRRTIDGMNTIRETIQDTSKRIKRLGESSQEIGNIVELINDIAEQTNILALNASIQASMAGEAGRGFAVVADEVQRLAERSTNATKQIEVLVKTIQADTNEAVVSMERSTTDVVSGALLAENAGAALDEIEKVSNQIASLVQNISGTARLQATAATDVTRNMGVLQEISAQTAENTGATSRSISKLADMASQLRRSVAGFTLPKEVVREEVETDDEMLTNLASEENEFIETLIVKEGNKL